METLVIIGHPDSANSHSQQFLLQTGQALTEVDYFDLGRYYKEYGEFKSELELERLANYSRIILQFQLYWYQAPFLLKMWIDQVFHEDIDYRKVKSIIKDKELGFVVVTGSKGSKYQAEYGHGVTISELLSPYHAFANYWQMRRLPYFPIHEFHLKAKEDQWQLMIDYVTYLESGKVDSFQALQETVLSKLPKVKMNKLEENVNQSMEFQLFIQTLEQQADQLSQIYHLNQEDF